MKIILLLIIMMLSFSTTAQSVELLLGGWSKHHVNTKEKFNENHKIIGIKYNNWSFGKFTNSYNNQSVFLDKTFEIYKYNNLSFNIVAGIVTGYTKEQTGKTYIGNGKTIYLMPTISYQLGNITVINGILPIEDGFILTTSIAIRF